jgi:hypothetical protein
VLSQEAGQLLQGPKLVPHETYLQEAGVLSQEAPNETYPREAAMLSREAGQPLQGP